MTPAEQILELSDGCNSYAAALASANYLALRIKAIGARLDQIKATTGSGRSLSDAEAKIIETELREISKANEDAELDLAVCLNELQASQKRRAQCALNALPLLAMMAFCPIDLPGVTAQEEPTPA